MNRFILDQSENGDLEPSDLKHSFPFGMLLKSASHFFCFSVHAFSSKALIINLAYHWIMKWIKKHPATSM